LTQANASTVLGQLQNASSAISTQQAALGADQVQLQYQQASQETDIVNTEAANSTISDLDMAQGSTILAQNQLLSQANIAMLAQSNANMGNTLNLLA
jgi:flagellin